MSEVFVPGFPCELVFLANEIILWSCGEMCRIIISEFNPEEIIGYEDAFGDLSAIWGDECDLRPPFEGTTSACPSSQ